MIKVDSNYFIIETKNLSYIFHVRKSNYIVFDYFGDKIKVGKDKSFLGLKEAFAKGTATILDSKKDPSFSSDNALSEFSFSLKGDYKEPAIILKNKSRGYTFDFRYFDYKITKPSKEKDLPKPHDLKEELIIILKDVKLNIYLELHYLVNENYDVIVRNSKLINKEKEEIELEKLSSLQLDLINKNFNLLNLSGTWGSETYKEEQKIHKGIYINDSKTGNSSNKHNPFFLIKEDKATFDYGEVYSFNLMYSGNHQELVELNAYDHLHIQVGINPFMFHFVIKQNEEFETPYAIVTYSSKGTNLSTNRMHDFINNCVINKKFKNVPRPIIINNWEGTYFKFNEKKLLSIARNAKQVGVEMFVLDDGWFSNRDDDTKGLGDYDVNKKKLPHDLKGLAKKINKMGLKFGLWFEPESINENSKLYKLHPEWVIRNKDLVPSRARNQLLLDLTNDDVKNYIIKNVSSILESANISYVKWDMNRNMSDIGFSNYDAGEFFHRYILGLYKVIKTLTEKFPNVLFENCASGGNRFDLGMLHYFPQTWASDNTDHYERLSIQSGLYYGYPLSTISNHVSHKSAHSTLRKTSYGNKFNVASFGVLGYELMMNELNKQEKDQIKKQILFYKKHRKLFQFGNFYKIKDKDFEGDSSCLMVQSSDKKEAIIGVFGGVQTLRQKDLVLKGFNFNENKKYKFEVLDEPHDIKLFGNLVNMISPVHLSCDSFLVNEISKRKTMDMEKDSYVIYGSVLNNGLILKSEWFGNGYSDEVRIMADFGSRLYYIKQIDK